MSRQDDARLADVVNVIEAIKDHLTRGSLDDGMVTSVDVISEDAKTFDATHLASSGGNRRPVESAEESPGGEGRGGDGVPTTLRGEGATGSHAGGKVAVHVASLRIKVG